jgi:hypothetical protein
MKSSAVPKQLKPVLLGASQAVGRVTAGARMRPAFLIAGAQRCGTTSMYRTLAQHPAILKAVWHKGVHYFDLNYDKGMAWYRSHFPLELTASRLERQVGVTPLTYESSPYYMWHPLAPERYARDLPGVKVVVLLRDPVERAYSAYTHEYARGFETETFEHALALEQERIRGQEQKLVADGSYHSHAHQHQAYLTRGQYVDQLERVAAAVGRDRLLVLDSDDFFLTPEPVYAQVLDFLDLPDLGEPVFERHNARPRSAMPEPLRERLSSHFAPYDARLEAWLGWTPSWRR